MNQTNANDARMTAPASTTRSLNDIRAGGERSSLRADSYHMLTTF